METKKKRLTLDLDPTFQRRLKAIAALKGVSMRGYCQAAIDRELTRDEANGMAGLLSDKPDHELFAELRQEIFGGKPLPGSSADLIREARESRDAEDRGVGVNGSVVVDASLAVKWLVEEDDSYKAHAVLQSWVARDIARIAPHLLPFEVANALHQRVLRGELNVADSIRMMARLLASRLELHEPPGLHIRALQLASQLNQNAAYDAHYLALAETFGCELWTADERFYRAASSSIDNVRWLGEFVAPE